MRGLFSFLFGASMLLVIDRAEANGEDPATRPLAPHGVAVRVRPRASVPALVGRHPRALRAGRRDRVHASRELPVRWLIGVGLACIALQTVELTTLVAYTFDLHAAARPARRNRRATSPTGRSLADQFGQPSARRSSRANWPSVAADGAIWSRGAGNTHAGPITSLTAIGPETLGFMLFGMARAAIGLPDRANGRGERYPSMRSRSASAIGCAAYAADRDRSTSPAASTHATSRSRGDRARDPVPPAHDHRLGCRDHPARAAAAAALTDRIAAAGRMAFTNYLGTSLICTTLFYGYGLGWYGASVALAALSAWSCRSGR